MNLSKLGQIAFTVKNLDSSIAFYRDVLGVPFLFQAGSSLAFFDLGGVRLMITTGEGEEQEGSAVLYFSVPDIDAAYADLGQRGVSFVDTPHLIATMPDHELWMVFFRDPDGYLRGLMAEKPLPETA
jgi:methylmalonyl-CoA/ethylmalonyl-CoA epimerase